MRKGNGELGFLRTGLEGSSELEGEKSRKKRKSRVTAEAISEGL